MAHFNAAANFQGALAVGTGVTCHDVADILDAVGRAIALPVDPAQVVTVAIGATDKIGHHCSGTIDNQRDVQVDRTQ